MDLRKFRTLARNWEALGGSDPLFGVLSDPTKYGGKWEVDEFLASGRAHVDKLLRSLEDARATFGRGVCLDFGCGVGRLTIPLAQSFARTIGVDVAASMVEAARRFLRPGDRCEFIVNRDPDLRQFPTATFDVVHSCLVLQHIPPDVSLRYIGDFFRVAKPGGLVVFQLPAERRSESEISAAHALPDGAHRARFTLKNPPATLTAGERVTLPIAVGNESGVPWPHDIPSERHIYLGNHWLRADGTMVIQDDGRAVLPKTIGPGEEAEISLTVQAPSQPGSFVLEIDLVQEHICWFAQAGSPTARNAVTVAVRPASAAGNTAGFRPDGGIDDLPDAVRSRAAADVRLRPPFWKRLLWRFRGGTPTFEMHAVPRADVERAIAASGGTLLRAIDDNAAGARWLSYTYVCRR
jgi:SAM-dependent methyltransferase